MSEVREIPLDRILPPRHIDRTGYDPEKMASLVESIAALGLLQPVGVRLLDESELRVLTESESAEGDEYSPPEGEWYELVWGKRRYLAHQQLGRKTILARIVTAGEQETDDLIMHENLHREDLNPLDEARWMASYMERYNVGVEEMARRARCSATRVYQLLSLLKGDDRVSEALARGEISKAQALAINRIADIAGREQALHWAKHQGMSAETIARWAEHRRAAGIEGAVPDEVIESASQYITQVKHMTKCVLHDDFVDYAEAQFLCICSSCWAAVCALIEWYQSQEVKPDLRVRDRDWPAQQRTHTGPVARDIHKSVKF